MRDCHTYKKKKKKIIFAYRKTLSPLSPKPKKWEKKKLKIFYQKITATCEAALAYQQKIKKNLPRRKP